MPEHEIVDAAQGGHGNVSTTAKRKKDLQDARNAKIARQQSGGLIFLAIVVYALGRR
jgi:hypothetical protein